MVHIGHSYLCIIFFNLLGDRELWIGVVMKITLWGSLLLSFCLEQ